MITFEIIVAKKPEDQEHKVTKFFYNNKLEYGTNSESPLP